MTEIYHKGDTAVGVVVCGIDVLKSEDHHIVRTTTESYLNRIEKRGDRKLCKDCFVGEVIVRDWILE